MQSWSIKQILTVFMGLFTLIIITHLLHLYHPGIFHAGFLTSLRWMAIASLIAYGLKKNNLTTWIFLSMVIGTEIGHDWPQVGTNLKVLSDSFGYILREGMQYDLVPGLFSTLVVGIAGHADMRQVGRMGWKSLLYFEVVTTIALIIGLCAINFTKAGAGIDLSLADTAQKVEIAKQSWDQIILHTFPENIAKAVAEGQVLQIVVFSILFALGLSMVKHHHAKETMLHWCESLSEVMFKFTHLVMYLAPLAVGAALAYTIGKMGFDILKNLFFLLTVFPVYCHLYF